jgi:phospholipid/cholesterol/gamma-HCH transport system substrate-binding protein
MKAETKVGLLFLASIALVAAFAYYLGALNPFSSEYELDLGYNFAGGIEVGSPVRVMGIKVGKVKSIDFDPSLKDASGREVKLRVRVGIDKKAWPTVRADSKFFVNLAGVIGEKYVEVSPGSSSAPELRPGSLVRGEDPPRIDQLISQSYGLAGKIIDLIEKHQGSVVDTIDKMNALVSNLNKTLALVDKTSKNEKVAKILENATLISGDLELLTRHMRGPEAEKTLDLVHRLLWRLDKLDEEAIRKFLQKEGIKAHLF